MQTNQDQLECSSNAKIHWPMDLRNKRNLNMEVTAAEHNILILRELKADSCVELKMLISERQNNF